jgi:hypothetical protein
LVLTNIKAHPQHVFPTFGGLENAEKSAPNAHFQATEEVGNWEK